MSTRPARRGPATRWMTDGGLAVVLALVLAFQVAGIGSTWGGGYWWFGAGAGGVVCLLALARLRAPAVAAASGLVVAAISSLVSWRFDLPAEPGPAMALALAVLLATAVRQLPVRAAFAVAAGGLVVIGISLLTELGSTSGMPVVLLNSLTWLGGVATGLVRRLLADRRERAFERVRRDERLALARELHDVVAHHVTGIVVEAQAGQLDAGDDAARATLAAIETEGAEAMAAMRRVVGLLRDSDGAVLTTPGPERLARLVERFEERGGPAVEVSLTDDEHTWPPEIAGAVYRVVQESLTNVARHAARATVVTVRIERTGALLGVRVGDDADAVPRRRTGSGYGLVGMRERVEALGGTLDAGPDPSGRGWSVAAVLPLGTAP